MEEASADGAREGMFWDEWRFAEEFGSPPWEAVLEETGGRRGGVCCRVCGSVFGSRGALSGHLGAAHGVSVSEYSARFRSAPLAPPENPQTVAYEDAAHAPAADPSVLGPGAAPAAFYGADG